MLLSTALLMWRAWTRPDALNRVPVALLALGLAGGAVGSSREEPLSLGEWLGGATALVSIAVRLAATGPSGAPDPVSS